MSFGSHITAVITNFTSVIEKSVTQNFSVLYDAIFPVWIIGLSVYFTFTIYRLIHEQKDLDLSEFIKNMMVLAVITAFLGESGKDGYFTNNIVPFVMNSGDSLSALIFSGGEGEAKTASSQVELIFEKTNQAIDNLWQKISKKGWFDDKIGAVMMGLLQTLLYIAGGIALALFAFVYIIITKIMIGILLSLGSIFIMLSVFPATRQMFTSWIGACANYILLNVCFSISFVIILDVIGEYTYNRVDDGRTEKLMATVAVFFLYVAGIFILQQITVLVSSLTGGVGINGLTSSVTDAMKRSGKISGKSAQLAGKATAGVAKFGLNKIRGGNSVKP